MGEMKLSVAEITKLMEQMERTGLGKLVLEDGDFKLNLSAKRQELVCTSTAGTEAPVAAVAAASASVQPTEEANARSSGNVMEAPIVGTFYSSPAPDKEPFVAVGKQVKKGDVLFIIESMKLMNEIQSEYDGEVAEILVEDGAPVEYGQPIMVIR